MTIFKTATEVVKLLEKYFDTIDKGFLVFKEGVSNYIYNKPDSFLDNVRNLSQLEASADETRREIEDKLYMRSLLPQERGDIMKLLDGLDGVLNKTKKNLLQFDIETPNIPAELNQDFLKLTELSLLAAESVLPAVRSYFRAPDTVRDQLHRVYFYETETDKLADSIKRRIFKDIEGLKLSEKSHLRYFTLHIENISDMAENIADHLSIMAIKRTI